MSAAVVASHAFFGLTLTGGDATYIPDSSEFVAWPTGTVAKDRVIIHYGSGWFPVALTGWVVLDNQTGTNANGIVMSKRMTAADITAGGVTVTTSGGSFPGATNIVTLDGSSTVMTSNPTSTGAQTAASVPSTTEQVVSDMDLTLGSLGSTAVVDVNFWWSMSHSGLLKTVIVRLRRGGLTGTVLASNTQSASTDSTAGHDRNWLTTVVDTTPTTGQYVITVQCTTTPTDAIWSDTRQFEVATYAPGVIETKMVQSASGSTSVGVTTTSSAAIGDLALYFDYQRVNSTQGSSRGTLLDRVNGSNASGGCWWERITSAGTVSVTLTSGSAGSGYYDGIVLVR